MTWQAIIKEPLITETWNYQLKSRPPRPQRYYQITWAIPELTSKTIEQSRTLWEELLLSTLMNMIPWERKCLHLNNLHANPVGLGGIYQSQAFQTAVIIQPPEKRGPLETLLAFPQVWSHGRVEWSLRSEAVVQWRELTPALKRKICELLPNSTSQLHHANSSKTAMVAACTPER